MSDGDDALSLPTPGNSTNPELASREFHFPYPQAYSIQLDLMRQVFSTIETGKVGLFESPTGTGKSLSLICAAFTWLEQNAKRHVQGGKADSNENDSAGNEPDWVVKHEQERKRRQHEACELDLKHRIAAARVKQTALKKICRDGLLDTDARAAKRHRSSAIDGEDSDEDLLIDETEAFKSEQALRMATYSKTALSEKSAESDSNISLAVRALMQQYNQTQGCGQDDDEEPETLPRIVYASRTHSQLSQFVAELKKTSFGQSDVLNPGRLPIRTISLGSRKQMCINEDVQRIGRSKGSEAMNERCLELMKGRKGKPKCPSLPTFEQAGRAQILEFRDAAMAEVGDIEDLVQLGRITKTCPYFAARSSAKQAELVTLPYNLLLQKDARNALGISLEGCIVLIDEAHNLIETILSTHSVTIDSRQIVQASKQIDIYIDKFALRLKGSNEQNLRKLRKLLSSMSGFFSKQAANGKGESEVVISAMDLVKGMAGNSDQINLVTLETWLKQTQIARKISGYADRHYRKASEQVPAAYQRKSAQNGGKGRHALTDVAKHINVETSTSTIQTQSAISSMHAIEAFILSLANRSSDGRVVLTKLSDSTTGDVIVRAKYQLLNPSHAFRSLVEEARSVILAGGTMEPLSDFRQQLLPFLPAERLVVFSCGHVIPPANLLATVLSTSPKGVPFEFKFDSRDNNDLLDELGRTLVNLCSIIPAGLVIFVPSYAFLDKVLARWKELASGGVLGRIGAKKKIFMEPKTTMEVDKVLGEYTAAIAAEGGAVMFAVVGAKLSEGINFSDDLARGVVMVGMPFANMHSPELAERMKYVRELAKQDTSTAVNASDPGHELYTNLCMKAVNQCIGRAVRHQNDYAALILLDKRYARPEIRQRLPGWIRNQVTVPERFGGLIQQTAAFFKGRKA
ncbi:related to CHL1 - protein of the DEAH box family [Melanopsichium pennsylvanicum]|uniref:ATP-dependent DNA helicase CHL1 n=2 Tax=Melanopsichium pennsylvanicum TaxID=63383 RepID=A0AAJ4XME9_9BASI|nr:related to CHL1-protein of the DEAH box family [Melanopsichium pennsylvanicum 4]SNX85039.1 related to CHL1 - protein of the DEAH box family [Melanopsichium pennsylvanicum]